jgi:hypothetical protein
MACWEFHHRYKFLCYWTLIISGWVSDVFIPPDNWILKLNSKKWKIHVVLRKAEQQENHVQEPMKQNRKVKL